MARLARLYTHKRTITLRVHAEHQDQNEDSIGRQMLATTIGVYRCRESGQSGQSAVTMNHSASCRGPIVEIDRANWPDKSGHFVPTSIEWPDWPDSFHMFPKVRLLCTSVVSSTAALMLPVSNGWIGLGR
jgi:hypothetical protein